MWTFWRNVTEEIECYIREMFRVCDNFECDCTDISWYDSVGLIRVPTRSEWITHNLINFIAVMGKMCVLQIMLRLDSFMLYIEYNFSLLSTYYILVLITVDITIGPCPLSLYSIKFQHLHCRLNGKVMHGFHNIQKSMTLLSLFVIVQFTSVYLHRDRYCHVYLLIE